jgi:1,4-alpha-glucan branching enzyme
LPWSGEWEVILDTDAAAWWGSGHRAVGPIVATEHEPWQGQPSSALLDVGPMSMLWLASPERP